MGGDKQALVDQVIETLGDKIDYATMDRSYSPWYSDMGLGFEGQGGIAHLFLHYNRRTAIYGAPFLTVDDGMVDEQRSPLAVTQRYGGGSVRYAFYERNAWLLAAHGVSVSCAGGMVPDAREPRGQIWGDTRLLNCYFPTGDPRDPDVQFPFALGVRLIRGVQVGGDGVQSPLVYGPDEDGKLLLAMSCNTLDVDAEPIIELLQAAPEDVEAAMALTREWFATALGELPCAAQDAREAQVLARAAFTLAFNACRAPGLLAGRISSFPSRGGYATHFLWDSCFQNLALEHMDPRLAEDAMLLLTENLRSDGKMPHFICSTWVRPHESQPPLVGWAGLRLVKRRNDLALARQLLPALIKNTDWWLAQRMTRYGVIQCLNPLETGWDDSPRLDRGATLACDMNSHLLAQMRAIAELAAMLGEEALAAEKAAEADAYAHRMAKVLYDPQENLFKEVLVETGEMLDIQTPACFLPLWAGVPLPAGQARAMIETYLLNPTKFFGPIPFPSVAYDEPTYRPERWWRGPTWLAIAYLMLDLLGQYGYVEERRAAAQRLYDMIVADGDIRELFNSQTGEGMGRMQQGWTAAILLQLKAELG